MSDGQSQLNPQTMFQVSRLRQMTNVDRQVLDELYRPILGASAYSLATLLFGMQTNRHGQPHSDLLTILGFDLPTFIEARKRLEAVGLLKSYSGTDHDVSYFVYEWHGPVSASDFLIDDLLSVELLATVGEHRFRQLIELFEPVPIDVQELTDISANFLQIFHPGHISTEDQKLVTATKTKLGHQTVSNGPQVSDQNDFDFDLLNDLLSNSYVDLKQLTAQRSLILTEHLVYGLTEIELARQIEAATDLASNQFDANRLKANVAASFNAVHERPASTEAVSTSAATLTQADQPKGQEQALITAATDYAPADFLQVLKDQRHGFVTDGEQRVLRQLMNRHLFSSAVLNILVYHLIVDEDHPTLSKNLMDTIANDWAQSKVQTPEAAILAIRNRQEKAKQPARRNSRRQGSVKETLPDWAKENTKATPIASNMDDQKRQQVRDRLKQIAKENEDKEG